MKIYHHQVLLRIFVVSLLLGSCSESQLLNDNELTLFDYPNTEKVNVVDEYFDTKEISEEENGFDIFYN